MSKNKGNKFSARDNIVGKDTILPTPDKSADPPQPQGKYYLEKSKKTKDKG